MIVKETNTIMIIFIGNWNKKEKIAHFLSKEQVFLCVSLCLQPFLELKETKIYLCS